MLSNNIITYKYKNKLYLNGVITLTIIYLSPSTQEFSPFIDGGNEEYYMNLIVDEVIPYLNSSGIKYRRNNPNQPVSSAIIESNQGNNDLYLSIHAAKSPGSNTGNLAGPNIHYMPGDPSSVRMANITAQRFKEIYPYPENVNLIPAGLDNVELADTNAPAILIEVGYRDNSNDTMWIRENIENIAEIIAQSITEYFALPLVPPQVAVRVNTENDIVLHTRPSIESPSVITIPARSNVLILGEWEGWYVIDYLGNVGYAQSSLLNK